VSVATRRRLDTELVRRGLARSRDHAAGLVEDRLVRVDGTVALKTATQVSTEAAIVVSQTTGHDYASRGAHKLVGALDTFGSAGLQVTGRRALDAGASTGGFTDVLLRREVAHVDAVDVGYGQLAWSLRTDPRVTVRDRTNVRSLNTGSLQPSPDLVVADLSFISLTIVIPHLVAVATADADFVLMVKPQFEVGRSAIGRGGVVRDPDLRAAAVVNVVDSATDQGLALRSVTASPLPGPAGNVEYFVWLRPSDQSPSASAVARLVRDAVEAGPA